MPKVTTSVSGCRCAYCGHPIFKLGYIPAQRHKQGLPVYCDQSCAGTRNAAIRWADMPPAPPYVPCGTDGCKKTIPLVGVRKTNWRKGLPQFCSREHANARPRKRRK